jgi:hypothetical protein
MTEEQTKCWRTCSHVRGELPVASPGPLAR